MADDVKLSENFTLAELTRSGASERLGLDNTPGPTETANLKRLAEIALEPMRKLLGVRIKINSGYRSEAVNKAAGSTAKRSAHLDGLAADTVPRGLDLKEAFNKIRASAIPYDQVILEPTWIHIGIAAEGVKPRKQALIASGKPGAWSYVVAPPLK